MLLMLVTWGGRVTFRSMVRAACGQGGEGVVESVRGGGLSTSKRHLAHHSDDHATTQSSCQRTRWECS
jgi:hypothetical protein